MSEEEQLEWFSKRNELLEKEIERLKEQLNDEIQEELKQSEIMVKKQQEIERLNNIINELEKYFEQEGFWHSLDKIKELKENK